MNATLQLKRGYYYTVINYKDETGKTKYKWISTGFKQGDSKRQVNQVMKEQFEQFEQEYNEKKKHGGRKRSRDVDESDACKLFTDYCLKYIENKKEELSKQVYYNYKNTYMSTFREFFDKKKLRLMDVTEEHIKEFYKEQRSRGIKEVTLKKYNSILRPALKKAYLDNLIPDFPFDYLKPLHREKTKISYYDKGEMRKLLEVIKGHSLEVPFTLAAYYGFRRSEVLGLRWDSIDFEHKLISINHKVLVVEKEVILTDQLKTRSSCRTLPLIPVVEKLLLQHREQIEKNKKFFGNTYDNKYLDYVCVEENGKIVYPDHMTKSFRKLLIKHDLRHIRLHDLRHSCASNMLANGVPLKEIQEWLGHSNFATTADVYSHLDYSFKVLAANVISSAYSE